MNNSFGPWAAGLDMPEPSRLHLSTFWKSRLLRLSGVNCNSIAIPRRALFALFGAAFLLFGIPGVNSVPARSAAAVEPAKRDGKKATDKRPGSLYVRGFSYRGDRYVGMWIVKVDPKTGKWKKLFGDANRAHSVRISPDGQTMAYNYKGEIWSADTDTAASPGRISKTGGTPLWSPDGKTIIACHSTKTNDKKKRWKTETWQFSDAGDNRAPLDLPKSYYARDWSPDGKWLIRGGHKKGLWLVSPDGKRTKHLAKAHGWYPRFSPNSKQIAYCNGWKSTLLVTDVRGTKVRRVFRAGGLIHVDDVNWSRDGRQLATLLRDMQLNEKSEKTIDADPLVAKSRLAIIDLKTGKHRVLKLPVVDGITFYPTDLSDWK